jgi:putative ABC transport system substrate-binding protein
VRDLKAALLPLGLRLSIVEARQSDDFPAVFAKLGTEPPDALFVVVDPMFFVHRAQLAELALRHRLPSMHGLRESR